MAISYDDAFKKWTETWALCVLEYTGKEWNHSCLSGWVTLKKVEETYIRKFLQEQFRKSDLCCELMETFWHPDNYEKFKYLLELENELDM